MVVSRLWVDKHLADRHWADTTMTLSFGRQTFGRQTFGRQTFGRQTFGRHNNDPVIWPTIIQHGNVWLMVATTVEMSVGKMFLD